MSNKGYSIVSVLVAMVLLGIGILALVKTTTVSVGMRYGNEAKLTAVGLVSSHMEAIKLIPSADMIDESVDTINAYGEIDVNGAFVRWVDVDTLTHDDIAHITVFVEYPQGAAGRDTIDLTSLRRIR